VVGVGVAWEGEGWDLGEDRVVGRADGEDHGASVANGLVGCNYEQLVLVVRDIFHCAITDVCDWFFVDETIHEVISLGYAVAMVGEKGQRRGVVVPLIPLVDVDRSILPVDPAKLIRVNNT
jgi:hypothetical protein